MEAVEAIEGTSGMKTEDDTKHRILRVSLDLFVERGFEGAGINEIAGRAGITKSVIYYHFKNKEAILEAIFKDAVTRAIEMKREIGRRFFEKGLKENELGDIVEVLLTFVIANKKAMRLSLLESIKDTRVAPLLSFWDENVKLGAGMAKEAGIDIGGEPASDAMLEAFFMLLLPLVGFAVLEEKWASHFGVDPARMRRTFENVYKINMKEFWFQRLFKGLKRDSVSSKSRKER